MSRSATPILSLETAPPTPRREVSAKGLGTAIPAAIGVVALIPAAIYLRFVLGSQLSSWAGGFFFPVSEAIDLAFQNGPVVAVVLIWMATFFVTVIHELGHAAAAILVGWPVTEFRVVPFSLQKHAGPWKLHLDWKMSPPALVMAHPSAARLHSKVQVYALAGPAANLATAALIGLVHPEGRSSWASMLILVEGCSLLIGVFNLLPIHVRGLELDGYVALIVSRKPKLLSARVAAIKMRDHIRSGRPLESMNQRWIALAEGVDRASLQNRGGVWLAYAYWLERNELERAAIVLEKLLRQSQTADERFRALLFAEGAVLSALRGQPSSANVWKERASHFALPGLIFHRVNSYVAWANQNMDEALLEAELTSRAADDLDDKQAGERFRRNWIRWIERIEKGRAQTKDCAPNRGMTK